MPDVVVTVPSYMWKEWLREGDLAQGSEPAPWEGLNEYVFYLGGRGCPNIQPGERVYIVARKRLRGYAPLVRVTRTPTGFGLVRRGGAVAVTLPGEVASARGYRYRWWDRSEEIPFPDWRE